MEVLFMKSKITIALLVCALAAAAAAALAQTETPATTPAEQPATTPAAQPAGNDTATRVAAIKANLVTSMQTLKTYQWTETQVVNLKGEDKSAKQFTCAYGADGKVVKTPVAPKAEPEKKGGLKGKIIENKKEDMAEYMQSAVALIKSYIPPDPAKLQAAKDAGKISMTPLDGGKRMRLDVKDYQKPGDVLGIEVDAVNNQISGLSVATYLENAKDAVKLDVKMAALADGTGYPANIVFDGTSKQIKVTITNSDYKTKS
jgi:opacity protein-like surface antigen